MARKSRAKKGDQLNRESYAASLIVFEALREEAVFILSDAIDKKKIKIHSIESRVKNYESLLRKWESSDYHNLSDVHDIVGIRGICLFKTDLAELDVLIKEVFSVESVEDKVNSTDDTFGYMSVHYQCKMRDQYVGPRYDKVKGHIFEIQVRTLCMHAWAVISHYLDYKAEWDIPQNLKKGLNALSGLFFVADEQYESLYKARQMSRLAAGKNEPKQGSTPINLDTLQAFLLRILPDRRHGAAAAISTLVRDLVTAGYSNLESVEEDFRKAAPSLKAKEEDVIRSQAPNNDTGIFFVDVGAVRVALRETNAEFAAAVADRIGI